VPGSPPSPPTPDQANWARIRHGESLRDVRDHIARFADSPTMPDARRLLEELVWRDILIAPTEDKLNVFTDEFPDGRYFAEAMSLLEQLVSHGLPTRVADYPVAPKRPGTAEGSAAIAGASPEPESVPPAAAAAVPPPVPLDEATWARIRNTDSKEELRGHVRAFPGSATARAARARLEDLMWLDLRAAATVGGLEKFLQDFPDSRHAASATQMLQQLKSSAAWNKAVEAGLREELEDFIAKFPTSSRTAEAERMLAQLAAVEAASLAAQPSNEAGGTDAGAPVGQTGPLQDPQPVLAPAMSQNDGPTAGTGPSTVTDASPIGETQPGSGRRSRYSREGLVVVAVLLVVFSILAFGTYHERNERAQQVATPVTPPAVARPAPVTPPARTAMVPAPDPSAIDARLRREKVPRGRLEIAVVWNGGDDIDLSVDCPGGSIDRNAKTACRGTFGRDVISEGDAIEHAVWMSPPSGPYNVRLTLSSSSRQQAQYLLRVRKDSNVQTFDGVLSPGGQRNQAFRFP
jgi:hypothetical protein